MKNTENKTVIQEIRQGARQLVRELDVVNGAFLGTGYTLTQCHVLFELSVQGSIGLLDLADSLLMDKSNTSRTVKRLVGLGLVTSQRSLEDSRQKFFSLTPAGNKALTSIVKLADSQVESALEFLSPEEQKKVVAGLNLYSTALRKSRLHAAFEIRRCKKSDNLEIASIIREVMAEFGATGDGYSESDPEVDNMFANYRGDKSVYFVIEKDGELVGGGGMAPLVGGNASTCEIRKMFFLPSARGFGLGRKLLKRIISEARERGYADCYIETLKRMEAANALYESVGFQKLEQPLGATGHSKADIWYRLVLQASRSSS